MSTAISKRTVFDKKWNSKRSEIGMLIYILDRILISFY